MRSASRFLLPAVMLAVAVGVLRAGGAGFSSESGSLIPSEEMQQLIGGECSNTYKATTGCFVNQNENNNPCPGTDTCDVSSTNPQKCIKYTIVAQNTPRCLYNRRKKTNCSETATGMTCAETWSGDKVNGTCVCDVKKAQCGSGTYTAEETDCAE